MTKRDVCQLEGLANSGLSDNQKTDVINGLSHHAVYGSEGEDENLFTTGFFFPERAINT